MSRDRVLITGETGFLGKRVRASLDTDPGMAVSVLGKRLTDLEPGHHLNVDIVIHLAAWTTKRAGSSDLEQIIDANVVGLHALLSTLDPAPRRFLFASTADVYGIHSGQELHEHSPLDPTDAYAVSKLLGEHMVVEDARAREYEACVIRIGHLYGPGEEAYEKFVPTAIRSLMKGRPPTVEGDGQTRRDLLYVDDAAEAIRRLALTPGGIPTLLNLAAADTYTLEEIAQTLIDIVGFMGSIRYLSDHSNPASVGFDTTLLGETIGEWDRVVLTEGLRREIEHVVANERSSERTPGYA
jgi:UDP-glucose 4-epimerase